MAATIMEKIFVCDHLNNLENIAQDILYELKEHKIIAFYGEMGAGKTTLIKSICKKLGVTDAVSSPTFSIMNQYEANNSHIYHFDFYRINNQSEAFDLGYENFFFPLDGDKNYCFIEWPEKVQSLLPVNHAEIHISSNNQARQIKMIV